MLTLFDNITAIMIGGVILLILMSMQHQAQTMAVERSVTYVAKQNALEFGTWMQEDIANIGAGMTFGSGVMEDIERSGGMTTRFRFQRKLDPTDVNPQWVEYRAVPVDTVVIGQHQFTKQVVFHRMERRVDGNATESGSSMGIITDFDVELLDIGGRVTNDRSAARQLRVSFASAFNFRDSQKYLRENHWSTTVPLREMN